MHGNDTWFGFLMGSVVFGRGVTIDEILAPTRGLAHVCLARQIVMALAHTSLSMDYPDIGKLFNRDRTTVQHACTIVEDMRDDPKFDAEICLIEDAINGLDHALSREAA